MGTLLETINAKGFFINQNSSIQQMIKGLSMELDKNNVCLEEKKNLRNLQ